MAEQARQKEQRRTKRWRARGRVVGVSLAAVLGLGYLLMPWWLPTGWIARRFAADLTGRLGVPVHVGDVSVSWSGVEVSDIVVDPPPGFDAEKALRIETLRTEFAPIGFLLGRQVDWAEIDRPRVVAEFNAAGESNLSPLARLSGDPAPGRVYVRDGELKLKIPQVGRPLVFRVSELGWSPGGKRQVGRVTVTGAMEQGDRSGLAPVKLAVAPAEEDVTANFKFTNVDLSQAPWRKWLPLREVGGRCDGEADLRFNQKGEVDDLTCRLTIRKLAVRPESGPALPVVEEAGFELSASVDWVAQKAKIKSLGLRLPGIDVREASAVVFGEVLEGNWQAIEKLQAKGRVEPGELEAFLTGRPVPPDRLAVSGPVEVSLAVDHKGSDVRVDLEVDAKGAMVRRGGRVFKPAGRALAVSMRKAAMDDRTWNCEVPKDGLKVVIGGNVFLGWGLLDRLKERMDRWPEAPGDWQGVVARVRQEAVGLNWTGSWEIPDARALLELLGQESLARSFRLNGSIVGRCSIHPGPDGGPLAELAARIPAETELAVPGLLTKATGKAASLTGHVQIDEDARGARSDLELTVGAGRLGLRGLTADWKTPDRLRLEGSVDARRTEDLLSCSSGPLPGGTKVSGDLRGQAALILLRDSPPERALQGARLQLDLADATIECPGEFSKPAGDTTTLTMALERKAGESGPAYHLSVAGLHVAGRVDVDALAPAKSVGTLLGGRACEGQVLVKVELADAGRVPALLPRVRAMLAGGRMQGEAKVQVLVQRDGAGTMTGQVACDARGLEWDGTIAGQRRRKGRDVAAALELYVRGAGSDEAGDLGFVQGSVQLGANRVSVSEARARVRRGGGKIELVSGEGKGSVTLAIGPALTGALPEAAAWLARYGIAGGMSGQVQAKTGAGRVKFQAEADLAHLAVAKVEAGKTLWFTKPAEMPCGFAMEGEAALDGLEVVVSQAQATVGEVSASLAGPVRVGRRKDRETASGPGGTGRQTGGGWEVGAAGPGAPSWRVAAPRLESLQEICPALREYELGGSVRVEVTGHPSDRRRITSAKIECRGVRAKVRGMGVRAEGTVRASEMILGDLGGGLEKALVTIGSVKTDSLELAAGRNHGWLVGELADWPDRPAGSVQFMADYLDDKELRDWLSPPGAAADKRPKLPRAEWAALEGRALKAIDETLRPLAMKSRVKARVSIDQYHTWDPEVDVRYMVRRVEAQVSVEKGHVTGSYAAGLNGGLLNAKFDVAMEEPSPVVTFDKNVRDVIARDNIQPQLARFFPGNTVEGLFNQTADLKMTLRDYVANSMDSRYPLPVSGTSKTVALRGVTRGRAAPEAVTKIFPGLNLAEYRYKKMTSFSEHLPDGSAVNDMIFDGKNYDLYMIGKTDAEHIGTYDVGLILAVPVQSAEQNHRTQYGRMPILKVKARIEGGKLHDEEVSYPWPTDSLSILYNPIYRAWVNSRKAAPQPPASAPAPGDEDK